MSLLNDYEKEIEVEYDDERYLVRDNGAVLRKNKYRQRARPNDNKWSFGLQNSSSGYMFYAGVRVHRIVCTAFHGKSENPELVVDHIDTNKANNRPKNLRWVTRLENILLNPITCRRIEIAYGSLDAFFENPSAYKGTETTQNISWMRTVSKEEAERSYTRLLKWVESGQVYQGAKIGEWIYEKERRKAISDPQPSASAVSSQIQEWKARGELRHENYHSYRPEPEQIYFESLTPTAIQVKWRTKTRFPLCPTDVTSDALSEYASSLRFGEVFSENEYTSSKIVQAFLSEDDLVVLTRFDEKDDPIKPWAVSHISCDEEFIYHKNLGSFFTLRGALKEYCDYTGEDYEESIDDYS